MGLLGLYYEREAMGSSIPRVAWIVSSGPDRSHLQDVRRFCRLAEAKEYVDNLPQKPTGGERPYRIDRLEWSRFTEGWSRVISEKLVACGGGY